MDWVSGLTLGGLAILALVTVVSLDGIKSALSGIRDLVIQARDLRTKEVFYEVLEDGGHLFELTVKKPCTYERLVEMIRERDSRIRGLESVTLTQETLESQKAELDQRAEQLEYYKLRHETLVADKKAAIGDRDAWKREAEAVKAEVVKAEFQRWKDEAVRHVPANSGAYQRVPVETNNGIRFMNVEMSDSEIVEGQRKHIATLKESLKNSESNFKNLQQEYAGYRAARTQPDSEDDGTLRQRETIRRLRVEAATRDRVIDELKEGARRKSNTIRDLETAAEAYRATIQTLETSLETSTEHLKRFAAVCRIVKTMVNIDLLKQGALRQLNEVLLGPARRPGNDEELNSARKLLADALRDKENAEKAGKRWRQEMISLQERIKTITQGA